MSFSALLLRPLFINDPQGFAFPFVHLGKTEKLSGGNSVWILKSFLGEIKDVLFFSDLGVFPESAAYWVLLYVTVCDRVKQTQISIQLG